MFGGEGGLLPLDKGKANASLRGNSLGKGNVAKRQKDCCPAKESRPTLVDEPRAAGSNPNK